MRAARACRPLQFHQLLLLVSTLFFSTGTLAVEAFVDAALPGSAFAGVVPAPDGLLYGLTYDGGANGDGAIYSYDPATKTVDTLYSFNSVADGDTPYDTLMFDGVSGKFYGTASDGGPGGVGTLFTYVPGANSISVIRSTFDGYYAPGGPIVRVGDYFYGVAARANGAVYRMNADGTGFTIIHPFTDFSALPQTLTPGADGRLYGFTLYGGPSCPPLNFNTGCGTIYSLKPVLPVDLDEDFQLLYSVPENVPSLYPTGKPIRAADGRLYGASSNGVFVFDPATPAVAPALLFPDNGQFALIEGSDARLYLSSYSDSVAGAGRIVAFNKDGTGLQQLYKFAYDSPSTSYGPYSPLYRDATGNVFGTTEYTNTMPYHGTVFMIGNPVFASSFEP